RGGQESSETLRQRRCPASLLDTLRPAGKRGRDWNRVPAHTAQSRLAPLGPCQYRHPTPPLPACVLGQPIFPEQCSDDFRGWVRGRTGKRVGETSAGVSCSLRLRAVRRLRGVFYRVYGTRAHSVFLLHPRRGVSPPPGSPPPPPRPSKPGLAKRSYVDGQLFRSRK